MTENQSVWKLDDDAVVSAWKVLERYEGMKTEVIPLPDEAGMSSIAFALKDCMDAWAQNTEELAIDSTCEHRTKADAVDLLTGYFREYEPGTI